MRSAGEQHRTAPFVGQEYTVNCPPPFEVVEVTGVGGDQFPVWTLVTNAKTWDAVAKFSGPPGPQGGFQSLTYAFKYYAFDKDHVQGFAACA